MPPEPTEKKAWYDAAGLKFSCTQSGNCCTGPPGYVWLSDGETEAIAAHLGLDVAEFRKRHARRASGRWTLDELRNERGEYDCVFLTRDEPGRAGCSIYGVRPSQCRTWPFWPENLRSASIWRRVASTCPGMANGLEGQGTHYDASQIRTICDRTPKK